MFGLGITEIIIIVIALGVLFFGGKKITEWARNLGRFTGEFKKGKKEVEKELREAEKEAQNFKETAEKPEDKK
jgi:sec-independent protein translocase protein TatA